MSLKFKELLEISAKLRGENGCPWDKKQTIESLAPKVLEEAQEFLEAVQKGDLENVEEELGDVLFTLIMVAQVAKEEGKFDMESAMTKVGEKFISRHTWVFGDDKVGSAEEAIEQWNKNKAAEKDRRANNKQA